MSGYDRCGTCKEWGWTKTHVCPPQWQVRGEQDAWDDWPPVYALDAEAAAAKWCDTHDCENEYSILRSGSATVFVRPIDGQGDGTRVGISAESVPEYTAYISPED